MTDSAAESSAKIHTLEPPGPDAGVVNFLSDMKEQAQAGAAESVAVVIVYGDGTVGTGYCDGQEGEPFRLLGGLDYLKGRLRNDIEER